MGVQTSIPSLPGCCLYPNIVVDSCRTSSDNFHNNCIKVTLVDTIHNYMSILQPPYRHDCGRNNKENIVVDSCRSSSDNFHNNCTKVTLVDTIHNYISILPPPYRHDCGRNNKKNS